MTGQTFQEVGKKEKERKPCKPRRRLEPPEAARGRVFPVVIVVVAFKVGFLLWLLTIACALSGLSMDDYINCPTGMEPLATLVKKNSPKTANGRL